MTLTRLSPDRLRAAREAAGYSPEAAAELTGCSRATVYNAESGATTPRADTLARWARLYGVTQDSLFEGHDEDLPPPAAPHARVREKESTPNRRKIARSAAAGV